MSIIWGVLKERGATVFDYEIKELGVRTQRYATGKSEVHAQGQIGMGVQMNPTHLRAGMDSSPISDSFGNVVCFDGRLDNVHELASLLDLNEETSSDSKIVLAAFLRWGEECFSRLTGDWALSLWRKKEARLILARDHAGTRTLYFYRGNTGVLWSTYLDTFSGTKLQLSEGYVASYVSCLPTRDLTPYNNVSSVRPGHYIVIEDGEASQRAHWSPLVRTFIRYGSDDEYDEHFLALFGQSVTRRTGPGTKLLAQLSGGMDSTSIVCMSDHLRLRANQDADILDTVSFYDDSESSLNESSYFAITEAGRGKTGIHLNTAISQRTFDPPYSEDGPYLIPGMDSFSVSQERQLFDEVWSKGYRAVLSGIGGDEVLGGVPFAFPELADYLVTGKWQRLFQQSLAWCLTDRSPLVTSLYRTARYTVQLYTKGKVPHRKAPPWLSPKLKSIADQANGRHFGEPKGFGAAPHRLDNASTWWSVMDTLPHAKPQLLFRPEYRYPMLDKDLVTFLFSIPRDQIVRPGRRRAMMRRALRHIVPNEILERRRKAFQLRAPMIALHQAHDKLQRLWDASLLAEGQLINVEAVRLELRRCAAGESEWSQALYKTIAYELWLRALGGREPVASFVNEPLSPSTSLAGSEWPASSV